MVALLQPAGHGSVGATVLHMSPTCLRPAGLLGQVSLMVMVKVQEEKPNHTRTFQAFVCFMSINIPESK